MTDLNLRRKEGAVVSSFISADEMALRRDLAAAYRLVALNGWDDLIGTHISARVPTAPGEPDQFLLNPYGMLFDEITASSLVKVDVDGNILSDTSWPVNRAGFVVHSAVHMANHAIGCVVHLHTDDGVAVSALKEGLLPLNQNSLILRGKVSFHDYEGVAVNLEERKRFVENLGGNRVMFLRNHGTLSVGATVGEAFTAIRTLEKACTMQVRTLAMGRELQLPDDTVIAQFDPKPETEASKAIFSDYANNAVWPALLRRLDRICPDYKD